MTRPANTEPAFLPLTPPGQTPLRVMTIAGSDSGGGAGIQADMRTFAMLGLHGCVAVTAVTVQNSVGVKGFHEIPVDVVAGQIAAVASDIGIQAAKTGMLASTRHHRRRGRTPGARTFSVRRPLRYRWWSTRSAHPCTATRCCTRRRWIRFAPNCSRWQPW